MTDRLNELERLDRLRQSGALTEAEFEAEKRKLLAGEGAPASASAAVPIGTAGRGRSAVPYLLGVVALLAVVGAVAMWFRSGDRTDLASNVATPKPLVTVPAAPTGVRALPLDQQRALAAKAVFGKSAGATIAVDTGKDYGDGGGFTEQVAYQPRDLVWTDFGPVLISQGNVVDAAHVSAGKVSADYLKEGADGFAVVKRYPKAVVTGSFGNVGNVSVSSKFLSTPVIYAEGGGTWQGYSCSWGTLTALMPNGPTQVANFPLSYSDDGAVEDQAKATTIQGKIANIVQGKSFDIAYTGSRSFTEHYVFRNGKFVLDGGKSQTETC